VKKVLRVEPERFAMIREQAMLDELHGIDPGAWWARIYPGVTEIEFVVVPPPLTREEVIAQAVRASLNTGQGQ
jgi:hypothetical protein